MNTPTLTIRYSVDHVVYVLPECDQLMGVATRRDLSPGPLSVAIQYVSAQAPEPCELRLSFSQARQLSKELEQLLAGAR